MGLFGRKEKHSPRGETLSSLIESTGQFALTPHSEVDPRQQSVTVKIWKDKKTEKTFPVLVSQTTTAQNILEKFAEPNLYDLYETKGKPTAKTAY